MEKRKIHTFPNYGNIGRSDVGCVILTANTGHPIIRETAFFLNHKYGVKTAVVGPNSHPDFPKLTERFGTPLYLVIRPDSRTLLPIMASRNKEGIRFFHPLRVTFSLFHRCFAYLLMENAIHHAGVRDILEVPEAVFITDRTYTDGNLRDCNDFRSDGFNFDYISGHPGMDGGGSAGFGTEPSVSSISHTDRGNYGGRSYSIMYRGEGAIHSGYSLSVTPDPLSPSGPPSVYKLLEFHNGIMIKNPLNHSFRINIRMVNPKNEVLYNLLRITGGIVIERFLPCRKVLKVNVIGDSIFFEYRPPLYIDDPGGRFIEALTTASEDITYFKKTVGQTLRNMSGTDYEIPDRTEIPEEIYAFIGTLRKISGLKLFNVDIIPPENGRKVYTAVDLNEFPGYRNIKGAPRLVAETIYTFIDGRKFAFPGGIPLNEG